MKDERSSSFCVRDKQADIPGNAFLVIASSDSGIEFCNRSERGEGLKLAERRVQWRRHNDGTTRTLRCNHIEFGNIQEAISESGNYSEKEWLDVPSSHFLMSTVCCGR